MLISPISLVERFVSPLGVATIRGIWNESIHRLGVLCRADSQLSYCWLTEPQAGWTRLCGVIVLVGSACYGFSVGCWQAPLQGLYAAIKFPVLIFATVLGNAVLNGMVAQLFGTGLTFRRAFLAILMSFAIATLMLLAFVPVSLFLAFSAPPPGSAGADTAYSVILLTHVCVIAYAGVAANVRLLKLLKDISPTHQIARRVLLVWLMGNFLVGTQVSWIISPFIGSPHKPLMMIQEHPFQRNFFEYAFDRAKDLFIPPSKGTHHD